MSAENNSYFSGVSGATTQGVSGLDGNAKATLRRQIQAGTFNTKNDPFAQVTHIQLITSMKHAPIQAANYDPELHADAA